MLRRLALLLSILSIVSACAVFEDDGTRLAFALERGSKALRASDQDELVVSFEPHGGIHQTYEIRLGRSVSTEPLYGGYLTVGGSDHGGTSYHGRFVYVPKTLQVVKQDAALRVTLRKVGSRIDVVSLE